MEEKKTLSYVVIIIVLAAILGVLWLLIINNTNNNSSITNKDNNGGPGMNNNSSATYSAVKEITKDEDITSGEYKSNNADENAISVSGSVNVNLSGVTVTKTGDSDGGDNTSFYRTNSAIIAKDGANVTIKDANIRADAKGANGVFSYGGSATTNNSSSDNTTINISDSTITTSKDNSGGIMTTGVVSALNREVTTDEYTQNMIQIDAAINGGNSGGALLNSKGEVVGINSVKYSSSGLNSTASIEGMGFAIPISDVEDIIKDLINGKDDTGGITLGIEGYMTNSGNIASYRLPEGFYVSAITSGGNADKSELEIGNIITEIDNNKVSSIETIKKVLNKKEKGNNVVLKVKYVSRNEYKEKEITITLN